MYYGIRLVYNLLFDRNMILREKRNYIIIPTIRVYIPNWVRLKKLIDIKN